MFGNSFSNSTGSIDDNFELTNLAAILPVIASPTPKDSEPCDEDFLNESADVIEPSFDMTPMPSPNNDFLKYVACTSTPLFSNVSNCEADNNCSSSSSRANTPLLSNVSSQDSSVCSSNESTPSSSKIIGRKRRRRRDEWKDIKRKCLKNMGKAYLSRNGVQRDGKILKQPCPVTCRLKCFQKFDAQQRERIFNSFWRIGDHCRQWDYIVNHTEVGDTKYPSTTKLVSRRKKSIKYCLPLIESNSDIPNKVFVCKTMFLNTLSVGERTVQTALAKWSSGGGSVSPDRRGGTRTIVIDDEIKQDVLRHVKTFQPVESHYVRKDTTKIYLDSDLTFTKMFSLYNEWCITENITKKATTVRQYRDIINQNLNISFHKPKKDICNECHIYNTNKDTMTEEEKQKQELHMSNKIKAREMKASDKKEALESGGKIVTACFDFQKILNCPHGNVGLFYYKRKLSIYNFTIFDLASQEGFCYMWPESNGKHGACEVASCLSKFIETKVSQGAKEFRFWSDNCAGQNRNRIVFAFYTYAAKKYKITIVHRFLERGHTQNEADSVHALIERNAKNKLIYTPAQWFALVRWSKVKPPNYTVIEMSFTDFYNYKVLLDGRNWAKNTKNQKISWTKIREVQVVSNEPYILNYRYSFEEDNVMNLLTKKGYSSRRKNHSLLDTEVLEQCYTDHLPITLAKFNDLLSLCQGRIIPQEYHTFYQQLSHSGTFAEQNNSDSFD